MHKAIKHHEIAETLSVVFHFLLALDILFFGGVFGLAIVGIKEASRNNSCSLLDNSTQDDCIPSNVFIEGEARGILRNASTIYIYWLAGATGCGVLWAIISTITVACFSEIVRWNNKEKKDRHMKAIKERAARNNDIGAAIEMQPTNNREGTCLSKITMRIVQSIPVIRKAKAHEAKVLEETIGAYQEYELLKHHLRPFSILPLVFTLLSSLSVILGIICLLWGIAFSFAYGQQHQRNIGFFVLVEVLTTIILPTLLCAGVGLFAIVIGYITIGRIDLRQIIPQLVSIVTFESGDKYDYWVVNDVFYFPLNKKRDRMNRGFFYSVDTSPATWFLTAIVCSALYLVLSFFVDVTLDEERSVASCTSDLIDETFDCFSATTFEFVDCVNNTASQPLHCFKFLQFGVESNILIGITSSYAFYLLSITIFRHLFFVVHNLLQIKPTRVWGAGFLIVGVTLYTGSIAITVLWIKGVTVGELNLSLVNIVQIFMLSSFITFMGLLLILAVWFEKIKTRVHTQASKIPLVHYTDIDKSKILKIGDMDEEKWKHAEVGVVDLN